MAEKKKLSSDYAFFNLLQEFYNSNKRYKGKIMRNYSLLTREFLNYNDKSVNPNAYLRKPQFEALETYILLKEFFDNKHIADILQDYIDEKGYFAKDSFYIDKAVKDGQVTITRQNVEQNEKLHKQICKVKELYPNYIYALTMGLGKTVLMATCIFYEFLMAIKKPDDKRFCHNVIVFAPDKTVLESLREIVTMDKTLVVPPAYVELLESNIKIHFLENEKTTLNTLDNSDFNIIISNTQKIIVKMKQTPKSPADKLFQGSIFHEDSVMLSALQQIYNDDYITSDNLIINQRFKKLCRLKQIGIYVDEAHHMFGNKLKDSLMKKSDTSLRSTINLLAKELEKNGTSVVACYNYTGTPYVKNKVLPEVVYSYGLNSSITSGYLKEAEVIGYENVKDKDFLRSALKRFWETHKGKLYEGLPAKIAIFGATIEEVTDTIKPYVEEICAELGIDQNTILVNVGDSKITKEIDINNFKNLDEKGTDGSQKQIILLCEKGTEGWNCRSLFSVAMFRKPSSTVFVLQSTMRCMRKITDTQQKALIFLSKENEDILDNELKQNFDMTIEELDNKNKKPHIPYEVRVLPPPQYLTIKSIVYKYSLKEKEYSAPVSFGLSEMDYSKYERVMYVKEQLSASASIKAENIDDFVEKQKYSKLMLTAEVSKYFNKSCLLISRILEECTDGIELVLEKISLYNDIIYDIIIPKIFNTLYEVSVEEKSEDKKVLLLKKPKDKESYTFNANPDLVVKNSDEDMIKYEKGRSFHADTYCFDSMPEKSCFYQYIENTDKVESIFFTGMFTANQSELVIPYYDPEMNRMRNYYPDFVAKMKDGSYRLIEVKGDNMIDDTVVKAKKEAAEKLASASGMDYIIYKGSEFKDKNVLENVDNQ